MNIDTPTSAAELLDKLTILEIKVEKFKDDEAKFKNVSKEWNIVTGKVTEVELHTGILDDEVKGDFYRGLVERLKTVNQDLWDIEDELRELEADGTAGMLEDELNPMRDYDLDPPAFVGIPKAMRFVQLARRVYITNDQRAAIKKELNTLLGSSLVEEKGYKRY